MKKPKRKKATTTGIAWVDEDDDTRFRKVILTDELTDAPPEFWKRLIRVKITETGPYVHGKRS